MVFLDVTTECTNITRVAAFVTVTQTAPEKSSTPNHTMCQFICNVKSAPGRHGNITPGATTDAYENHMR
jgi:hypothetical protein